MSYETYRTYVVEVQMSTHNDAGDTDKILAILRETDIGTLVEEHIASQLTSRDQVEILFRCRSHEQVRHP